MKLSVSIPDELHELGSLVWMENNPGVPGASELIQWALREAIKNSQYSICKHCDGVIFKNSQPAPNNWTHKETGQVLCSIKAEPFDG